MSDSVDDEIQVNNFIERFGLDQDRFDLLATYLSIMTRRTGFAFDQIAKGLKVTRPELEDIRSNILDILLEVSKMVDQDIKENDLEDVTITDRGVGVFKHERITRAVIHVIDGIPMKDAAERAGIPVEALEPLTGMFETRLLYMGACAFKANPDWTVLDVLKSLSEMETFAEWNDQAAEYLEEDQEAADAAESEESDEE